MTNGITGTLVLVAGIFISALSGDENIFYTCLIIAHMYWLHD